MSWRASVVGSSPRTDRSGWLIANPVSPRSTRKHRPRDGHGAGASGRSTAQVYQARGTIDGAAPGGVPRVGSGRIRRRLEGGIEAPVGRDVGGGAPDALRQSGQVGGSERGGLLDHRPRHRHLEIVGLELEQEVVGGRAAVGLEGADGVTGRLAHRGDHVARLEADGVEHGPGEVGATGAPGDADDGAPGVGIPPRAPEAGEGRDHDAAIGVGHRRRERRDVAGPLDDAEPVSKPLHRRARREDRSLERVRAGAVGQRPADRREEPVHGIGASVAHVHEHEAPGPVGVLGHAGFEAGLAEEGGLLVPGDAGHRDARRARPSRSP